MILGYALAALMGVILGLIGAGGSILTLPIFVYLLNVPPLTASAYSLLVVGLTALIGSARYYYRDQIDLWTVINFSIPSVIAVYLTRRFLLPIIPDPLFHGAAFSVSKDTFILLLFSCLMLAAGLSMLLNGHKVKKHREESTWKYTALVTLDGVLIGVITGIVGAGGGFLIVPVLVMLCGLEMKTAIGTSLMIIALKSLLGFVGDLQQGLVVDYWMLELFMVATVSGMMTGLLLSNRISAQSLKKIFGFFSIIVGAFILLKETI